MSDLYIELLVKKKRAPKDTFLKGLMITATVLFVLTGIVINFLFLIPGLVMLVLDYFFVPTFDLEYEYLYVNGELDIDKIMSKQKRKRVARYDMKNVELVAPKISHDLDSYKNNKNLKVRDFSSQDENAKVFGMVIKGDKAMELVYFEPNDAILKDMQRIAPRNVKLY